MKFLLFSATALLTATTMASCNPLESTNCAADTALASSFKEDFSSESKYFDEVKSEGLSYSDDGLEFKIAKRYDNPSIKSNFYIMFGKVQVILKAAKGTGIVSSFYLQSDDLDEIDIELFGGDAYEFQSNWFSKGSTTTYDRGGYHSMSSSPLENYHNYTIEYTKDFISWSLDGSVVRTLLPDNGQGFPQTPMYIMAGVWAGGDPSNAEGTIEWAGGETNYDDAPFSMYIQSLVVVDYSTGSEYSYGDQSGDWSSIEAKGGKINGREAEAKSDFDELVAGGDVSNTYSAPSTTSSASTKLTASSSSKATSSSSSEESTSSSSVASKTTSSKSSASKSSASKSTASESTNHSSTASTTFSSKISSHDSRTSAVASETDASAPISESLQLSQSTTKVSSAEASSHFATSTTGGALSASASSLAVAVSSKDVAGTFSINTALAVFAFMGYLI